MTKQCLVTIGITCYNAQNTIGKTIFSAINQTWNNLEIIIVDDFSQDDSLKVIKQSIKGIKNVRLIEKKKNMGYPNSLNMIIENAKGEYIAFFDDDDESLFCRIEKQYNRIQSFIKENKTKKVICYSDRNVYVNNKIDLLGYVKGIGRSSPEPHGDLVIKYIFVNYKSTGYSWGEFGSCTMMAATETFKDFPFDENFRRCSEWDFAVRCASHNYNFISVNQPLVKQFKTQTEDKAGNKPLKYSLMLRGKYKELLMSQRYFISSLFFCYSRFYVYRGCVVRGKIFFLLSCLFSFKYVLLPFLKRKLNLDNK